MLESAKYIYQGVVCLCGAPYQENQKDESGATRKVWMFPLITAEHVVAVSEPAFESYTKAQERRAQMLSANELKLKAKERSSKKAAYRAVTSNTYVRDPYVAEYAKERAHGICQLCGQPAPFRDQEDRPYLESHHIIWLAEDGPDSIENTVALCPNCHRKMHIVNDPSDKALLLRKALE